MMVIRYEVASVFPRWFADNVDSVHSAPTGVFKFEKKLCLHVRALDHQSAGLEYSDPGFKRGCRSNRDHQRREAWSL